MNEYNIDLEKAVIVLPLVASKCIVGFNSKDLEVGVNDYKEAYIKGKNRENLFLLTIMKDGEVWYSGDNKTIDKEKIAHDINYYIDLLV